MKDLINWSINKTINIISALLLLIALHSTSASASLALLQQGPGISQEHFSKDELFNRLSIINKERGSVAGHSSAVMYQGYLVIVEASDSGKLDNTVISFWDISNAREPKLVIKHTADSVPALNNIPEAHSVGFIKRNQKTYAVIRTSTGISIWDWSQISTISQVADIALAPLTTGDYANTAWWFANVGRYIYVSATNHGLYVVDAANLNNLHIVKHIPISQTGGFKLGSIFGLGNMLVATAFDNNGITTFNIDKPENPRIADIAIGDDANIGYASMLNGGYLYGGNIVPKTWDLKNINEIKYISNLTPENSQVMGKKGAYSKYKDGFVHQGVSNNSAWIDYQKPHEPKLIQLMPRTKGADLDSGNIAGHIGIASCDHGKGSQLFPISTAPDTKAPELNYSLPANGDRNYPKTASIGLSFSDQLDQQSVNENSVYLTNMDGTKLESYISIHDNFVSLTPIEALKPSTSYQVIIAANHVKDFAQNAITEQTIIQFSTGEHINTYAGKITEEKDFKNVTFALQGLNKLVPSWWQFWQDEPQISWAFGDGSKSITSKISDSVIHQFKQGGKYTVQAKLVSTMQHTKMKQPLVFSKIVVIANHQGKPKGTSSNTLAHSTDGQMLYVSNPDNNTVTAINTQNNILAFEQSVGKKPRTLAYFNGNIWVVNQNSDELIALNGQTGKKVNTIKLPYGTSPYGLLIIPSIANNSNKKPTFYAYISSESTGAILVIDLNTNKLIHNTVVASGGLRGLAYNNVTHTLYAARFISDRAHGEIFAINPATLNATKTITLPIEQTPDREDNGRGLPNYLSQIAISPSAQELWYGAKKDNIVRGLVRDGQALTFDNSVRAMVSKINLTTQQEVIASRIDLDDRALPHTSIFSHNGNYVFVSVQGSNIIEIINSYDGSMVATINTKGNAPEGLALSADSNTLYVHSQLSRQVEVYDVSLVVENNAPQVNLLSTINLVANETMAAPLLTGKKIFYNAADSRMSLNGYLSCASCHLDGGQDGRVWDFTDRGEGLRNTTSLTQSSGSFFHWSANFNEIQDFEHDIRGPFGGTGFTFPHNKLTNEKFSKKYAGLLAPPLAGVSPELDKLSLYTASLANQEKRSPYRQANGKLTADGQAGKVLFNKLQCQSCHGGDNFAGPSQGILANVGTIKPNSGQRIHGNLIGLDIPTLRGLWQTAPYLHDGSANTLTAVFTEQNKADQHGKTSQLSNKELSQLTHYLLQIDSNEPAVKTANINKLIDSEFVRFMTHPSDIDNLGKSIANAINKNKTLPVYSNVISYNVKEAYKTQTIFSQYYSQVMGSVSGFKVAFASKASQQAWGLKEAVYAPLFQQQNLALTNKAAVVTVNKSDYHHFHIEAELAFVLNKDVTSIKNIGSSFNPKRLKKLIQSVHIAYDIPDNRFIKKPQATDIIASGAGAKGYLLGKAASIKDININDLELKMYRNNELVYKGNTSAVMGSPLKALHWLLKSELKQGKTISKNSVILTGAVSKAYGAVTKDVNGIYTATAKGLGTLTVTVK